MAGQKRTLEEEATVPKSKKTKLSTDAKPSKPSNAASNLVAEEVDFPRGGGTTFTPIEVKNIRAEAVKEANHELFQDAQATAKSVDKKRKRKSDAKSKAEPSSGEKTDRIRIEHLNYKRLTIGMKILGQIVAVEPLALIVSLPNQLFAHVPITQISSQFTTLLEKAEDEEESERDSDDEDGGKAANTVPDLFEIFRPGQYVRAVVTNVRAPGATDTSGVSRTRDEAGRASKRVELSLIPERVNEGVQKTDLRAGFTLSASVKTVEDHGYILEMGVPDVSGFLSFQEAKKGPFDQDRKLHVGRLVDVTVSKLSANGRTCNVAVDPATFSSSLLTEITNVTSLLPGTLVQALITAVHPTGLNLQVLGYFDGTVDEFHLRHDATEKAYKIGKKVKARVLYDFSSSPPKFALSLAEHVLGLGPRRIKEQDKKADALSVQEVYPIGTVLDAVTVTRVDADRGLIVEIAPSVEGFIHISHVSDDHVPSLSSGSGPWKIGSIHRARVTGYFAFDGLVQLSLKTSVIDQKFLQVTDVHVGEIVKGTIKKLTDSGLFVSLAGNIDGIVWPDHYADIMLKQPAKKFKGGDNIRCRVLAVDPDRKKITLTAKKTLLDSTLPLLTDFEAAQVGMVTHAVVSRLLDKGITVEFYNRLKALIPMREISETAIAHLGTSFPVGRVVKVRITSLDLQNARITASIRQAASNFQSAITDISGVEVGHIVEGSISEIHTDNVAIILHPTQVRAIISLKNLANHRNLSLVQLRAALKVKEKLQDLVVVSRSPEKGFVIVASKPKVKSVQATKGTLSVDNVSVGQVVNGRITSHTRHGALVKLGPHLGGILHPADASDNYEAGNPFPAIDTLVKAAIVSIDAAKKQVVLSTRHSRIYPDQNKPVIDREVRSVSEVEPQETVRGFIKAIEGNGLYVTLGRNVDARVQIKELFDNYVKDWAALFKVNQLVNGRILKVDAEKKQIEMTFRSKDASKDGSRRLSDFSEGDKVDGIVRKVEDYGLFILIDGTKVSGLCHKSELTDTRDADVSVALRGFREGDRVKAVILKIENKRVSFSLKPSHFDEADYEEDDDDEESGKQDNLGAPDADEDIAQVDADAALSESSDDEDTMQVDVDAQSSFYASAAPVHRIVGSAASASNSLRIQGGFQWSGNDTIPDGESGSESSSEDEEEQGEPSSKHKKRKRKAIEVDHTADMHTKTPDSNADFERLLLGSPNSSYLWIQYMSFQLQLSEVDKAREIAQRALRTINFREEQEKLNVWIALLNLENAYGTEETLETTFKEAARHNDSKTVHLRLALILDEAGKHAKAEEQYKRTCKKFGQSSKVWTLFGEHCLKLGAVEQSRALLPRSLQSLDKRKHLKTISKFAQLEYKLGDAERGKTVFEGIIDSHPKRWDLWSVYMDMEASQGDIQSLRNLFDRVLAHKMTSHKAKSFFKKWFELEHRLGDEEGAAAVKAKAIEWTELAKASAS